MLSSEQQKAVRNVAKKSFNKIDELLISHKLPNNGFSESLLIQLLECLAAADSNNFNDSVGGGEREGRISCPLVGRLHYGFLGLESCKKAIVLPVCTGMALTLSLLTLKQLRPSATHVIFSRIDQKSCLKSIFAARLIPIIVDQIPVNSNNFSQFRITVDNLEDAISSFDSSQILCILSTTSCFAPRVPDSLIENGKFARKNGFFHLVNNAYGLQSPPIISQLSQALSAHLIDIFVQSTDKNFQTPVGGSIISSSNKEMITKVGKLYPGRASAVPSRDFLLTILHMGKTGLLKMMEERNEIYNLLARKMKEFAVEICEEIVEPEGNGISLAMSLSTIPIEECKKLGGILFSRYKVTGTRVIISNGTITNINGCELKNFGSHSNFEIVPYITVAAGVGMSKKEVEIIVQRLREVICDIKSKSVVA
uniref:O-phosphoseryl-tRNA(Sec) selenium transferase n=1 Tax=Panagrolaimus sp. ES5 TaxID=591445 RepID=A0AC34G6G7_9BILA